MHGCMDEKHNSVRIVDLTLFQREFVLPDDIIDSDVKRFLNFDEFSNKIFNFKIF